MEPHQEAAPTPPAQIDARAALEYQLKAVIFGILGFTGFAFNVLGGGSLILAIVAIIVLLVAGWWCERLAQNKDASLFIRLCADFARMARRLAGAFAVILLLGIIFSDVAGRGRSAILGAAYVIFLAIWAFPELLQPKSMLAKRRATGFDLRRHRRAIVLGLLLFAGIAALWLGSATHQVDGRELRLRITQAETVIETFYLMNGRLPDEMDYAKMSAETGWKKFALAGPGVMRLAVDLNGNRQAYVYLMASKGGPSSGLSFRCAYDDDALEVTSRFYGDLQCERRIGLDGSQFASVRAATADLQINIYFEFDRSQRSSMLPDPQKVAGAQAMKTPRKRLAAIRKSLRDMYAARQVRAVEVVAYADVIGTEPYNVRLSQERAESVRVLLEEAGIPAKIISVRGAGPEDLRGDCARQGGATAECNSHARRAEIYFRI